MEEPRQLNTIQKTVFILGGIATVVLCMFAIYLRNFGCFHFDKSSKYILLEGCTKSDDDFLFTILFGIIFMPVVTLFIADSFSDKKEETINEEKEEEELEKYIDGVIEKLTTLKVKIKEKV